MLWEGNSCETHALTLLNPLTYVGTSIYIHTQTCAHAHVYRYTYTHMYMHSVLTHICTHTYMHTHTHAYTRTHTHITHTHTNTQQKTLREAKQTSLRVIASCIKPNQFASYYFLIHIRTLSIIQQH